MLAHSFLIDSSSKLLVTRTGIKARISSISVFWFPWPIYMFFEMRFDLGTLDSGERSLPFGLLVWLLLLLVCCCFSFPVFYYKSSHHSGIISLMKEPLHTPQKFDFATSRLSRWLSCRVAEYSHCYSLISTKSH